MRIATIARNCGQLQLITARHITTAQNDTGKGQNYSTEIPIPTGNRVRACACVRLEVEKG